MAQWTRYQIWGNLHDKQYPHLHAGPFHLGRWYLKSSTVTDVFMWGGKEFHSRAPWYFIVWIPYLSVQTLGWTSSIPPRKLYLFSFTSNKSCMKEGLILLTLLKVSRTIFLSLDMYISGWSILFKSSSYLDWQSFRITHNARFWIFSIFMVFSVSQLCQTILQEWKCDKINEWYRLILHFSSRNLETRDIAFTCLDALLHSSEICLSNFNLLSIWTPSTLTFSFTGISVSLILKVTGVATSLAITIPWNFEGLACILLFRNHSTATSADISRRSFSSAISWWLWLMLLSSA